MKIETANPLFKQTAFASNIWTTAPTYGYTFQNNSDFTTTRTYTVGTSFAAPHVSGAVGLMLSVNPSLTPAQIKTILTQSAKKVPQMGTASFTNEHGHGRLDVFEALRRALPDQMDSPYFSSNQTLGNAHIHTETMHEWGTLTIPADKTVLVSGYWYGYGAGDSKIQVHGRLTLDANSSMSSTGITVKSGGRLAVHENVALSDMAITVEAGGHIEFYEGVYLDMGNRILNLQGQAVVDDDFTFRRGTIQVGSAGSLELTGAVDMEFREIPVDSLIFNPGGIVSQGKVTINGSTWSEMRLSSSATWDTWAGIQLSGSGTNGSYIGNVAMYDVSSALTLYSNSGIQIENVTVDGFTGPAVSAASSYFTMTDATFINGTGRGVDVSGGYGNLSHSTFTTSGAEGYRIESSAMVDALEVSMTAARPVVHTDYANFEQLNGAN